MTLLAWTTIFLIVSVAANYVMWREWRRCCRLRDEQAQRNIALVSKETQLSSEFLGMLREIASLKKSVKELTDYRTNIRKTMIERGLAKWHTLYESNGENDEWAVKRAVRLLDDDEIIKSVLDRRKA